MSDDLYVLVTLLQKDINGYRQSKVVLKTKYSKLENYQYFREPDVLAEYRKLIYVKFVEILAVEPIDGIYE